MSENKRPATPEEVETAIIQGVNRWNAMNPNFVEPETYWRDKLAEAEAEGYVSEVCGECQCVFLAYHHFTSCRSKTCPMKDGSGKSLLDQLAESIE